MSEPRTLETIHKEYSAGCAQAGHLGYQIAIKMTDLQTQTKAFSDAVMAEVDKLNEELKKVHNELKELNFEAAKLQAASKESEKANG